MRLLLTFIGALLNVTADLFLKTWADKGDTKYLVIGMLVYVFDAIAFAYLLKQGYTFVTSLLIWEAIVVSVATIWGVLVLKETFSLQQQLGMILAVAAIYLLDA